MTTTTAHYTHDKLAKNLFLLLRDMPKDATSGELDNFLKNQGHYWYTTHIEPLTQSVLPVAHMLDIWQYRRDVFDLIDPHIIATIVDKNLPPRFINHKPNQTMRMLLDKLKNVGTDQQKELLMGRLDCWKDVRSKNTIMAGIVLATAYIELSLTRLQSQLDAICISTLGVHDYETLIDYLFMEEACPWVKQELDEYCLPLPEHVINLMTRTYMAYYMALGVKILEAEIRTNSPHTTSLFFTTADKELNRSLIKPWGSRISVDECADRCYTILETVYRAIDANFTNPV